MLWGAMLAVLLVGLGAAALAEGLPPAWASVADTAVESCDVEITWFKPAVTRFQRA